VSPPGLTGYSRGLYSNWLWHQPFQLLFDAGEGLTLALGTSVFSIGVIAITHGHSDHLLGLPGLVGARRFGKGAQEKPYTVVYPAGSNGVEAIRSAITHLWRGVEFPITWTPVGIGDRVRLSAKRSLEAFAVRHVDYEPSFGYRVLEERRRLKADFTGLSQHEVEGIARQHGRDHVMEAYAQVVFAHSGDAMPIDIAIARDADLLVHDATFLEPGDRREPIHASSREVFELAREANVRTLVLNHLSIRYERSTAYAALHDQLAASGFTGDTWLLDESTFVNLR
jgi:ribonuclease Z